MSCWFLLVKVLPAFPCNEFNIEDTDYLTNNGVIVPLDESQGYDQQDEY